MNHFFLNGSFIWTLRTNFFTKMTQTFQYFHFWELARGYFRSTWKHYLSLFGCRAAYTIKYDIKQPYRTTSLKKKLVIGKATLLWKTETTGASKGLKTHLGCLLLKVKWIHYCVLLCWFVYIKVPAESWHLPIDPFTLDCALIYIDS